MNDSLERIDTDATPAPERPPADTEPPLVLGELALILGLLLLVAGSFLLLYRPLVAEMLHQIGALFSA